MNTKFFTSDTHFGHKNIIEYCDRPWDTVHEMNEALITYWNETIPVDATVYHIGDFDMGGKQSNLDIVSRLHGDITLVAGNHDACWIHHKKPKVAKYKDAGFYSVVNTLMIGWGKDTIVMNHFPKADTLSKYDDRYHDKAIQPSSSWHKQWLVHGHVHNSWPVPVDFENKQINVGVDVWDYKPVHEDVIIEIIRQ